MTTDTITAARRSILAIPLVLLTAIGVLPAKGQEAQQINVFARPGVPTVTVYVVGDVAAPGIWRIERGTDFVAFLSLLNVGSLRGSTADVRQNTTVRVLRPNATARQTLFEAPIEEVLTGQRTVPELTDEDLVIIETETRRRVGVRTVSTIIGALSSVALLIIRISDI